jgi:lipopolysaccharide transport system permease protein
MQLLARDLAQRHRGTLLGGLWLFVQPLGMLAIFTFVLTQVFHARWPGAPADAPVAFFAIMVFCGMVMFGIFSESLTRASSVVLANANLVKRVVFPLELLPVVNVLSALTSGAYGLVALLLVSCVALGRPPLTALLLPLPLLPLLLWTLGIGWFVAALGVFVRDLGHGLGIALQAFYFLTPVLFTAEQVPPWARPLMQANPLGLVIEEMRQVVILGVTPAWQPWLAVTLGGAVVAVAGLLFFRRSQGAFADVL